MSRRESCVWHPMPEEVRRSSVQSRRASLAAGRRKSIGANEPDWEVEAPPTPPRGDYSARDNRPEESEAAAAAAGPQHEEREYAAAAPEPESPSESVPAQEAEEEQAPIAPTEPIDHAAAPLAAGEVEAEADGSGRTRHTVRFHGDKWAKVLRKCRSEIESAFLEDIRDGAGVQADEAKRLKIKMHDCMEVTFVVFSEHRSRQKTIHAALQKYNFPKTCEQYVKFAA